MSPWAQRILSHDWNQRFCCLNPWNSREKFHPISRLALQNPSYRPNWLTAMSRPAPLS